MEIAKSDLPQGTLGLPILQVVALGPIHREAEGCFRGRAHNAVGRCESR